MNKYLKEFLHIGLIFAGFGPVIAGIVYYIVSLFVTVTLGGAEILTIIISTYLLAFVQAGASVFNRIEGWSIPKSLGAHLSLIYIAYVLCYLVNSWIPFEIGVVGIFTLIFLAGYFIVWITVYLIVKKTAKSLNKQLKA